MDLCFITHTHARMRTHTRTVTQGVDIYFIHVQRLYFEDYTYSLLPFAPPIIHDDRERIARFYVDFT